MRIAEIRLPGALVVLIALHALVLVAEPLAPYPADLQRRGLPYAAPTRLRFVDDRGQWHLVPFVLSPGDGHGAQAAAGEARPVFPVRFLPRGAEYRLAGVVRCDRHLFGVDEPGMLFVLGTDRYGRDIFSRLVIGARLSLFAGLLATALGLGLGVLIGGASGLVAGRADEVVMWLADAMLSLPWIYVLLGVRSLLPLDLAPARAFLVTAALIGVLGWARPARLVRAVALSARTRDYVLAARSCGASELHVLIHHVLPETVPVVVTQAAILAPRFVLAEVTLSLLGLGVAEPTPSLGSLAAGMLPPGLVLAHWWLAAPVLAMVPVFALYESVARHLNRVPGLYTIETATTGVR